MQDASKPIWINQEPKQQVASSKKPIIFVATPVHSECSIHYAQSLLKLQQSCIKEGIMVSFCLLKSSLVTQGRNLCVSNMFNEPIDYTHFFFVDSDIEFSPSTLFRMINADKDIVSVPYPMKTIDWDRIEKKQKKYGITDAKELSRSGFLWPIKLENRDEIVVNDGIAEVTHVPTGCTLFKRSVFETMMDKYPNLKISQPTIINGKEVERDYFYNFFDCYHDPNNKQYYGEDFGFCKRWAEIGGKCHILVNENISHVGEYRYEGSIRDDLVRTKVID